MRYSAKTGYKCSLFIAFLLVTFSFVIIASCEDNIPLEEDHLGDLRLDSIFKEWPHSWTQKEGNGESFTYRYNNDGSLAEVENLFSDPIEKCYTYTFSYPNQNETIVDWHYGCGLTDAYGTDHIFHDENKVDSIQWSSWSYVSGRYQGKIYFTYYSDRILHTAITSLCDYHSCDSLIRTNTVESYIFTNAETIRSDSSVTGEQVSYHYYYIFDDQRNPLAGNFVQIAPSGNFNFPFRASHNLIEVREIDMSDSSITIDHSIEYMYNEAGLPKSCIASWGRFSDAEFRFYY